MLPFLGKLATGASKRILKMGTSVKKKLTSAAKGALYEELPAAETAALAAGAGSKWFSKFFKRSANAKPKASPEVPDAPTPVSQAVKAKSSGKRDGNKGVFSRIEANTAKTVSMLSGLHATDAKGQIIDIQQSQDLSEIRDGLDTLNETMKRVVENTTPKPVEEKKPSPVMSMILGGISSIFKGVSGVGGLIRGLPGILLSGMGALFAPILAFLGKPIAAAAGAVSGIAGKAISAGKDLLTGGSKPATTGTTVPEKAPPKTGKIMGAVKGAGRLLGKVALPIALATSAYEGVTAASDADKILDKKDSDVTVADRVATGAGGIIGGVVGGTADAVASLFGKNTDFSGQITKATSKGIVAMKDKAASFISPDQNVNDAVARSRQQAAVKSTQLAANSNQVLDQQINPIVNVNAPTINAGSFGNSTEANQRLYNSRNTESSFNLLQMNQFARMPVMYHGGD